MGIFDFGKKEKVEKPKVFKRSYAAANKGRLLNDFMDSERSADSELRPVIKVLRSRSRDLSRNNEYAKRYLNLVKSNVVGDRGYTLQVKATGVDVEIAL
jgi:capsid protein